MFNNQKQLIIVGAGGHGKSVKEIAISLNYNILGFLDDHSEDKQVLGKIKDISNFQNVFFAMGIGGIKNLKKRMELIETFHDQYSKFVNLISPYALINNEVKLGIGNTIHPYVFINQEVIIGNFCIINTRATIEHDCQIGNNVHIATGAILNGNVTIENNVMIGSGALLKNNIHICSDVIIGMGSVVLNSINEEGIYAGNPLKKINLLT